MTEWICRSAHANDGIRRIHLQRETTQPEDLFMNVTPETTPEAFKEGDIWGVKFTLISRRGSNGQRQ